VEERYGFKCLGAMRELVAVIKRDFRLLERS